MPQFLTNSSQSNRPPTGSTASSGADRYKVNVSRQKTQKWANFKPANYGDGWGDDDEDEWDEPEPPPPARPMGPRQPTTLSSSSVSSLLPSQAPRNPTISTQSLGSLGSLPSQSQQSLATPRTPTKPPFVRPADIYKRLEEEKRQSLESARPSLSAIAGEGDRVQGEPTRYALSDAVPREGAGLEDVADANTRGVGPGLSTVPERKSEYGLEGLLDSYGAEETSIQPSRAPPLSPSAKTNIAAFRPIQEPTASPTQAGVELRRFSSSPQLPLVTRLSGFGEDLFSQNSFFAEAQQEPVNQTSAPAEPSAPSARMAPATGNQLQAKSPALANDHSESNAGPPAIEATAPFQPPLNQLERSAGLQDSSTAAPPSLPVQQQPAANHPREPASSTSMQGKVVIRPSLPGGWVSETPITPEETLLPAQIIPVEPAALANQSSSGTVGVPDGTQQSSQPGPDNTKEASSVRQEAISSPPNSLPPLRTSSPASSATSQMSRSQKPQQHNGLPEVGTGPSTAIPPALDASTQNADITPTAPLNPRRDAAEVSTAVLPVMSPPSNEMESILEADSHSPLKESDVLSEEIIKSLSPVQSSESFGIINGATTVAYRAVADQPPASPVRESSYLGDVYDDYWAASEEKADLATTVTTEVPEQVQQPPSAPASSTEAPTPAPIPTTSQTPAPLQVAPEPAKESASESQQAASPAPGDGRRRFSWEAGFSDPEPVVTQLTATPPPVEPKSLGSASTATPAIPNVDGAVSDDKVSGGISFSVSQASTAVPRSANTPSEPPSPVSVVSDKHGNRASPAPEAQQKLSLADSLIGASSASALTDDQLVPRAMVPRALSPNLPVNILSFRQIMEMGPPTERIKHFDETRMQFASIDTGLDEWLAIMSSKHPEHNSPGFGASREALQPPAGQSTHYHQAGHMGGAGLPANIPMPPPQHHGTGFGHLHGSSTKSRELLMAAGKAGKGLFSKGRNKLRGTGDKVFSNP